MKLTLLLYAQARELVDDSQTTIALDEPATIGSLRDAIKEQCPQLTPLLPHAMFAVDAEYASDATLITDNSTVALIPPVSGG